VEVIQIYLAKRKKLWKLKFPLITKIQSYVIWFDRDSNNRILSR